MRLLVSVKNGDEARAALDGDADIIDAKDPEAGALGAVSLAMFERIVATVAGTRLVTAALGDALDEPTIEEMARAFARAGAGLVKVGFAGIASPSKVTALLAAARRGCAEHAGVIATAYADAGRVGSLDPFAVVDAAATAGVAGVLIDTADKHGPGLCGLMTMDDLRRWVTRAHEAKLLVALAGKLTADELRVADEAGADIAGVRGAACDDGRTGQIVAARVRGLKSAVVRRSPAAAPAPAAASR